MAMFVETQFFYGSLMEREQQTKLHKNMAEKRGKLFGFSEKH